MNTHIKVAKISGLYFIGLGCSGFNSVPLYSRDIFYGGTGVSPSLRAWIVYLTYKLNDKPPPVVVSVTVYKTMLIINDGVGEDK